MKPSTNHGYNLKKNRNRASNSIEEHIETVEFYVLAMKLNLKTKKVRSYTINLRLGKLETAGLWTGGNPRTYKQNLMRKH